MHPSLRLLSSRAHQPLIKFLGKRTLPNTPDTPHAHPAAPAELKQRFSDLVRTSETSPQPSTTKLGTNAAFSNFWEAPERFWRLEIEDTEIDAILSGGASLH